MFRDHDDAYIHPTMRRPAPQLGTDSAYTSHANCQVGRGWKPLSHPRAPPDSLCRRRFPLSTTNYEMVETTRAIDRRCHEDLSPMWPMQFSGEQNQGRKLYVEFCQLDHEVAKRQQDHRIRWRQDKKANVRRGDTHLSCERDDGGDQSEQSCQQVQNNTGSTTGNTSGALLLASRRMERPTRNPAAETTQPRARRRGRP